MRRKESEDQFDKIMCKRLVALNAQIQSLREDYGQTGEFTERIDEIADFSANMLQKMADRMSSNLVCVLNTSRIPSDPTEVYFDLYLHAFQDNDETDVLLGEVCFHRTKDGHLEVRGAPEEWASIELQDWAGSGLKNLLPEILHAANWVDAK